MIYTDSFIFITTFFWKSFPESYQECGFLLLEDRKHLEGTSQFALVDADITRREQKPSFIRKLCNNRELLK